MTVIFSKKNKKPFLLLLLLLESNESVKVIL